MTKFDLMSLLKKGEEDRKLDLYVELPCLMKQAFNDALEGYKKENLSLTGKDFQSFAPAVSSVHVNVANTVRDIKAIEKEEELPDISVDFAVGDFISSEVNNRFIKKGTFSKKIKKYNVPFIDSKLLEDKNQAFNVLGLFPLVMLVNLKKLGDLPKPESFKDLLDPKYKGQICIPNPHHDLDLLLLHYILSMYGKKGLAAFKKNVAGSLNPTDSARKVEKSKNYSIFFSPIIFARGAVIPGLVEMIWPKEGNVCQPIVMLVKKNIKEENKSIIDFLLSEKIANVFSKRGYISTFEGQKNNIPENAKFSWPGFDYFLDEDFKDKNNYVLEEFAEFGRGKK